MGDVLSDAFRLDLRCSAEAANSLAARAKAYLGSGFGSAEDTDEDRVLRLQDPRVFGEFAGSLLADRTVSEPMRLAVVERTFDLLPLPRTEGEVILVPERSPSGLLSLAAYLAERNEFTVLHAMHLVYAVFLDRSLLERVPRPVRTAVLDRVLHLAEATEAIRLLYTGLHLGSVPESEALNELRSLLRSRNVPESFQQALAEAVSAKDGGMAALLRLAQDEGLLPVESGGSDAPAVLANIPRMPSRLAPMGRRWLRRRAEVRGGRDVG